MNWAILIVSGAMEAVWAVALERAEGFTKLIPSIIFIVALAASMFGLSHAVRSIPLGTAYAVWVGIGATLTVVYSMVTGIEPLSWLKVALLAGLVGCVIGLKLVHGA